MSFVLPRFILMGGGKVLETPALMKNLKLSRPLIVTDPFISTTKAVRDLSSALSSPVYSDTVPDPTTESVYKLVERMKRGNFDSLLAVGGGSPMDTAKAACVLFSHGGQMREYKAPFQMNEPSLPLVAVPTTAGTGSEVTRFTIISDSETGEKMLCIGSAYMPIAAVVDYQLTMDMPKSLTAHTGIDAFCHAMEAFVSRRANGFSDGLALKAVERIARCLTSAYAHGDAPSREGMMLASMEAGMAFSNSSVTLIHGMSRPIGAAFHVPHGLSNAMLAPEVTRFSLLGAMPRYALVGKVAGWAAQSDSDELAASKVVAALLQWNDELRVPTMRQFNIAPEAFKGRVRAMAAAAIGSGSPANNPVVPTQLQIEELYERIFA